ncbi:hypothetical protein CEXT_538891 [Caerostris extrusa]|uniref:Uncharacterized protein n=1 Tax=Caerostris extrusa TaxID=172846 RepID=A0AAV4RL00_CAEEX|nr:hypothetical protein CEXT_538891 [Caerostris extrusa]
MNVAVEMRQLNGKTKTEEQSSSGNWSCSSDINSSDSENKTSENSRVTSTELSRADSPTSNEKIYQNRYRTMSANPEVFNSYVTKENKEIEISSCTSSDNNATHDDITSNDTSTESEVFFISSDESEDSSDVFEHNCGSSLSLSTLSDGSLNSLLSQTGTEMTSSSGTLTSLGFESLPPPPPPPPPAIVAAKINDGTKIAETANLNADCNLQKQMTKIQSPTMSTKKIKFCRSLQNLEKQKRIQGNIQ